MKAYTLFTETLHGPWKEDKETDTQWDLRIIDGVHVLVFPPTISPLDWIMNFRFWKKFLPWRFLSIWKVHSGFAEKYDHVRKDIIEAVKTAAPKLLYIAGYSQGGGLTHLALYDLRQAFPSILIKGITFGSPRVVGWLAPSEVWQDLTCFETSGDPVVKVPPIIFGFKNVGTHITIGEPHSIDVWQHDKYAAELQKKDFIV